MNAGTPCSMRWCPQLFDGATPESLAIHEAIADLVAVLMALRSSPLRMRVLAQTNNDISNATAFSSIAERFGQAQLSPNEMPRQALRMLLNDNTMSTVDKTDPHPLSTVLSGLFYQTLVDVFEGGKANNIADGMAVGAGCRQVARLGGGHLPQAAAARHRLPAAGGVDVRRRRTCDDRRRRRRRSRQ